MDPTTVLTDLSVWLQAHWLAVLVLAVGAFVVFRAARPLVHRLVVRLMATSQSSDVDAAIAAEETRKRAETIEDLLARMIKLGVILTVILVLLTVLGLLPVIAGLGLIVAALALAGQSIVLDYLMGLLLLLEGPFYKGDTVRIGMVEGTVLEVGFRRTTVRDNRGIVHSISNGLIRESANLTRTYAVATIEVDGIADRDVEAAIEVLDAVGQAIAADPLWAGLIDEAPAYAGTTQLTSAGATLRLRGRVHPDARRRVEQEMRRRVAGEFSARGIEPIRPTMTTPAGP
jgi:small-conductance mechanosensitive channel